MEYYHQPSIKSSPVEPHNKWIYNVNAKHYPWWDLIHQAPQGSITLVSGTTLTGDIESTNSVQLTYAHTIGNQVCKYCPSGKEFISTHVECTSCVKGKYQQFNDKKNVKCLTCNKGKDAPSNQLPCVGCINGKYQPLDTSTTYTCRYCDGFQHAIEPFVLMDNYSPHDVWPPTWDESLKMGDPIPSKWKRIGNFSQPNAHYCPYFTKQSGRCDDQEGGVYILDHQTCTDGASAIGWNASDFF